MVMGIRRAGRIITLQSLYQIEIAEKEWKDVEIFIDNYQTLKLDGEEKADEFLEKSKDFAKDLVKGVLNHLKEIDEIIPRYLKNWKYERILSIDRNILRMGVSELIFRADIPYKVTINEMIELAKRFGDEKSGGFVNGVLDNIFKNEKSNYEILRNKTK
jgi:transcription antitermination protein NusB